jgi:aminoglycoside phosphotransferase (APT) family kinase protein
VIEIDAGLVRALVAAQFPRWASLPLLSAHVTVDLPLDRDRFAEDLATFLLQLRAAPAAGGPACGRHSFYRDALASVWPADPVWFHGDVAEGNLLVRGGSLGAVIDFGTCGAGDPACDLVIAWTFMGAERERFRAWTGLDSDTWARARGWALWKALVTLTEPGGPQYAVQERALANLLADAG